jgi:hypothetical protein
MISVLSYVGWGVMILCSMTFTGGHILAAVYQSTKPSKSPQPVIISLVYFFFVGFGFASSFLSKGLSSPPYGPSGEWVNIEIAAIQCAHQTLSLFDVSFPLFD